MIKLKNFLLETNNTWKTQLLKRFPIEFVHEILNERPTGTSEDIEEIKKWRLIHDAPISVKLINLLKNKSNLDIISRTPKEVVDIINKNWNLNIKYGKIYDSNPNRYLEYSKMSKSTAKPSIMVNGQIYWGVGKFIYLGGSRKLKAFRP